MTIRVEVTAEDIAAPIPKGRRCELCPVARATLRAARPLGFGDVSVGRWTICLLRWFSACIADYRITEILTPPDVLDFIKDFDQGRHCSPFAFDLEIPSPEGAPS